MKKIFKSTLAVLLAAAMLIPLASFIEFELPISVDWFSTKAEAATSGYYTYTVDKSGNATITSADESISGNVTIPLKLGGYTVTSIGDDAFRYCESLTSITIGNSVTNIGYEVFYGCENLTSINVDSKNANYSSDEYGALFNKNKTELIQYPAGNKRTSYAIPNSVLYIGDSSFANCENLTSITIGNSVTDIGIYAFDHCYGITEIKIPDSVTSIGDEAFSDCDKLTSISIPKNVTSIGDYVFESCDRLTSINVDLENTVYSSDEYGVLFNKSKSKIIKYPEGNLSESYTIYAGVKEINEDAFSSEKLKSIIVESNNTVYSNDSFGVLFNKNKTKLIKYPTGNTRTSYTIPDSVTSIGTSAFFFSNLISVIIPEGVKTIEHHAFYLCNDLTDIIIPGSVESIGSYAFAQCYKLKNVTISDSVTKIDNGVFHYCTDLKTITIGKGITSIGISAFGYCENLTDVYYNGTEKQWNDITIGNHNEYLTNANIRYNSNGSTQNIYNLGEETYSFDNFKDSDAGGHCFGMSVTSSGYYIGELDIAAIGGSNEKSLYSLSRTAAVEEPICYYQGAQNYSLASTVAGGTWYKTYDKTTRTGDYDVATDWDEVVNYVKNHAYDNKGTLQIGIRGVKESGKTGGHAINFLRYDEVNGQARIYAYDNNYPEKEVYFYKDSNGNIKQTPSSLYITINCIALRSIPKFFSLVSYFDETRFIYAENDTISIEGASVYPMECGVENGEWVMFEVPANVNQVTIIPLIDNAEFKYLDETYSFGSVDDDTVGVFTLASSNDEGGAQSPDLTIENESKSIWDIISDFFMMIIELLFGWMF